MPHVIKKQVIELAVDKSLDSFYIQELVSRHYRKDIVPLLRELFDQLSGEGDVLEIDRLEIDLGVISEKKIEMDKWSETLKEKLQTLLADLIRAGVPVKGVSIVPKRISVLKQWIYYMQKGYLPWNADRPDEAWYQDVLESLAVDFDSVQLLRHLILSGSSVVRRVVWQHPVTFLQVLAEIMTAQQQRELPVVIEEMHLLATYFQQEDPRGIRETGAAVVQKLWIKALQLAAGEFHKGPGNPQKLLVRIWVRELASVYRSPVRMPMKLSATRELVLEVMQELKKEKQAEQKALVKARMKMESDQRKRKQQMAPGEREQGAFKKKSIPVTNGVKVQGKGKGEAEASNIPGKTIGETGEEGILVMYAGLVLVHPFLKIFFQRCHFLDGTVFKGVEEQQKALCLLHYIATGRRSADEFELVIPKLLCAYPLEEPVEKDILPGEEAYEEADQLLDALIGQWTILKNSSRDLVREEFLKRGGKLTSRSGKLYLQVEKKDGVDILLSYLPWNLGMIMLPWSKDILRVEWG